MYQAWASAYGEGWRPMSVAGIPVNHVDRVFLHVYSGALAKRVTAGRRALPHAVPGAALVRRVVDEVGWQGIMAASLAMFVLLRMH